MKRNRPVIEDYGVVELAVMLGVAIGGLLYIAFLVWVGIIDEEMDE